MSTLAADRLQCIAACCRNNSIEAVLHDAGVSVTLTAAPSAFLTTLTTPRLLTV